MRPNVRPEIPAEPLGGSAEPVAPPRQFRKKPVVIEAYQMLTVQDAGLGVCTGGEDCQGPPNSWPHIHTLEGDHKWSPGDWVIRGVQGEYYFCKPDIFAATYEVALARAPQGDPSEPRPDAGLLGASDAVLAQLSRMVAGGDFRTAAARGMAVQIITEFGAAVDAARGVPAPQGDAPPPDGSPEYREAIIEATLEAVAGWNESPAPIRGDSLSGRFVGALLKRGLRIYPLRGAASSSGSAGSPPQDPPARPCESTQGVDVGPVVPAPWQVEQVGESWREVYDLAHKAVAAWLMSEHATPGLSDKLQALSVALMKLDQRRLATFAPLDGDSFTWKARAELAEAEVARLRGAAPAPPPPDKIGWLIEGDGPARPVWWTGRWSDKGTELAFGPLHTTMRMPRTTIDMEPEFSPDHACALRFARREDAERALGLLPAVYQAMLRVSEHMWMGASAPTPEPPRCPHCERPMTLIWACQDNHPIIWRGIGSPQPAPEAT